MKFRLWAPAAAAVELVFVGGPVLPMEAVEDGWFEIETAAARPGRRYWYRIDQELYPDPLSRYQPEGPLGPSEIVDPAAHEWQDFAWRGRRWEETVLYELHVGTFSESGDFDGVIGHLDDLARLGVTALELMPVAEAPGRWNWGYDGVLPYAVETCYGGPAGLKRLVDAAHQRGLSVLLDVVYNHFGPEGNFLPVYAPPFFTDRHKTPWGSAIDFDGPARDYFIGNALYWLREYHLDGLRFDAIHAIFDESFIRALGERIRAEVTDRPIHLVTEDDDNRAGLLGGKPYTAQWNDDFHHAMRVLLTGQSGGYYADYADDPAARMARVLTLGFAFQGEYSPFRNRDRGQESRHLPPTAFVSFVQNHDQVGNHAYGWRLDKFASPEAIRAGTAVLLLSPQIPMLFMGQEWMTTRPFPFFCDFGPALAQAVRDGRMAEFASFPEFAGPEARSRIPDPLDESTFRAAILDWPAREGPWLDFHTDLIHLRHAEIVPRLAGARGREAEVWGRTGIEASWTLGDGSLLTLVANLGASPIPGPPVPGRLLYRTAEAGTRGMLPAWFAAFGLAGA